MELARAMDVGELLGSVEMVTFLRAFSAKLEATGNLGPTALEEGIRLMAETLPRAVYIARKDLLKPWSWRRRPN